VREENARWMPIDALQVAAASTLRDAMAWVDDACRNGRIVAAGLDTLTEWNTGVGGWRPADSWLREKYAGVRNSVLSPNAIFGSMAVNGAAFLTLLAPRFRSDRTMITEAHPKVCFFAMTGKKHAWAADKTDMAAWLLKELGIDAPAIAFGKKDDSFDAGVALLAALRGLNHDWTLDLHAFPNEKNEGRVQFIGRTHYWWPGTASAEL